VQGHLRDLLLEHAPPPPALAQDAPASLIRMGFPQVSTPPHGKGGSATNGHA
jgi:hypothetical protein